MQNILSKHGQVLKSICPFAHPPFPHQAQLICEDGKGTVTHTTMDLQIGSMTKKAVLRYSSYFEATL